MYRDIRAGELCIIKYEAQAVQLNLQSEFIRKQSKWYRKPKFWGVTGLVAGLFTGIYIAK